MSVAFTSVSTTTHNWRKPTNQPTHTTDNEKKNVAVFVSKKHSLPLLATCLWPPSRATHLDCRQKQMKSCGMLALKFSCCFFFPSFLFLVSNIRKWIEQKCTSLLFCRLCCIRLHWWGICRLMTKHRFLLLHSYPLWVVELASLLFFLPWSRCVALAACVQNAETDLLRPFVHGRPSCSTAPCSVLFVQPSELISPQQVDVFSTDPRSTFRTLSVSRTFLPIVLPTIRKDSSIYLSLLAFQNLRDWSFTLDVHLFFSFFYFFFRLVVFTSRERKKLL